MLNTAGGYEVKTIGDSFFVAFGDVVNAVKFAVEMESEMRFAPWPESLLDLPDGRKEVSEDGILLWCGLRVRAGMHIGTAKLEIDSKTLQV